MGERYSDKLRYKRIEMRTKGKKRKRMLLNTKYIKIYVVNVINV